MAEQSSAPWADRPWENPEQRASEGASSRRGQRRLGLGCLVFALLIPALFLVGIVWNAVTGGGGKADAYNACRTSVKASLALPESADFEITRSSIDKTAAGYRVVGSVRAKNAIGGERRVAYDCEATADGKVLSVNVR